MTYERDGRMVRFLGFGVVRETDWVWVIRKRSAESCELGWSFVFYFRKNKEI